MHHPEPWYHLLHRGSHRAANKRPSALARTASKPLVRCCAWQCTYASNSSRVHPADAASVVQAVPSCYTILREDDDIASVGDSRERQTATAGITAYVRWQAAQMITCHRLCSCPAHTRQSACMSQRSTCVLCRSSRRMSLGRCSSQVRPAPARVGNGPAGLKATEGNGRQLRRLCQCWPDRCRVARAAGRI